MYCGPGNLNIAGIVHELAKKFTVFENLLK